MLRIPNEDLLDFRERLDSIARFQKSPGQASAGIIGRVVQLQGRSIVFYGVFRPLLAQPGVASHAVGVGIEDIDFQSALSHTLRLSGLAGLDEETGELLPR